MKDQGTKHAIMGEFGGFGTVGSSTEGAPKNHTERLEHPSAPVQRPKMTLPRQDRQQPQWEVPGTTSPFEADQRPIASKCLALAPSQCKSNTHCEIHCTRSREPCSLMFCTEIAGSAGVSKVHNILLQPLTIDLRFASGSLFRYEASTQARTLVPKARTSLSSIRFRKTTITIAGSVLWTWNTAKHQQLLCGFRVTRLPRYQALCSSSRTRRPALLLIEGRLSLRPRALQPPAILIQRRLQHPAIEDVTASLTTRLPHTRTMNGVS